MKPTDEDLKAGLLKKYIVTHADGTPTDENADYFVLRLDYHPDCDISHVSACREAILRYADQIRNHLPTLSGAIKARYGTPDVSTEVGNHAPNGDVFASAPGMKPDHTCQTCGDKTRCCDDGEDCRNWTQKPVKKPTFADVPIGAVGMFTTRNILRWSSKMSVKADNMIYDDSTPIQGWYWPKGDGK